MSHDIDSIVELARALHETPAELECIDLVDGVRARIAAPPPRRRRWAGVAAVTAFGLLLIGGVVAAVSAGARPSEGFRTKSATTEVSADRWVALAPYRVGADGNPERVRGSLHASDGVLFAYTNLGERPFSHLMVFGVSHGGRVHWFFPAYDRAGDDPAAVSIEPGRVDAELPELVRHAFEPGPLDIYGVFLREPRRVSEIEAAVATGNGVGSRRRLPRLPDSAQHVVTVEVLP